MATKKTTKKTTAEKTTTYSTRLNDEQRECIDLASKITGVSASKFIRDTALRAAADVVNASSPNDRAITAIAQRLADSLLNQEAILGFRDGYDNLYTKKAALNDSILSMSPFLDREEHEPESEVEYIKINSLSIRDIHQLTMIAESCPFAFAQAFLKAARGASEPLPEFSPRAKPDSLLSD